MGWWCWRQNGWRVDTAGILGKKDSEKERPLASTANIIVQWTNTILKDKW